MIETFWSGPSSKELFEELDEAHLSSFAENLLINNLNVVLLSLSAYYIHIIIVMWLEFS